MTQTVDCLLSTMAATEIIIFSVKVYSGRSLPEREVGHSAQEVRWVWLGGFPPGPGR